MALRGVKTLLFNKSCMTCKHDACDSILFGLLTGNCDCSWLITDDCRLSVSNTCLTYEQVTVGQQYLRASLTRDCQWLHAWGESITRLWAKSSKQSVGQHNFWWMSIFDKSKASIQSKARPKKEWGQYHMTPTPLPLNVYLGPPLLVLRWYLYPAYLTVTHGWVHDKFRSIII